MWYLWENKVTLMGVSYDSSLIGRLLGVVLIVGAFVVCVCVCT